MVSISLVVLFFTTIDVLNGLKTKVDFVNSPQGTFEEQAEFKGLPEQEAAEGQRNVKNGLTQVENGVEYLKDNKEIKGADAILERIEKGLQAVDATKIPKSKSRVRSNSMNMDTFVLDEGVEPVDDIELAEEMVPLRSTVLARSQISGAAMQKIVAFFFLLAALQMALMFFFEKEAKGFWAHLTFKRASPQVGEMNHQEVELVEVPKDKSHQEGEMVEVPKLIALPPGHPALVERSGDHTQEKVKVEELSVIDLLKTSEEDCLVPQFSSASPSAKELLARPGDQKLLEEVCSMLDEIRQAKEPLEASE